MKTILDIISYFDTKKAEYVIEPDSFFDYEIKDDTTVELNYGWTSYEEGDNNTILIKQLGDIFDVTLSSDGHCVMTGDYDESEKIIFDDFTKLMTWLEEQL